MNSHPSQELAEYYDQLLTDLQKALAVGDTHPDTATIFKRR